MNKTKKILVPMDFSRHSDAALARACDLAEPNSQELHLLHVVAGELTQDKRREALERLSRALEPLQELKLDVRREVAAGPAHRAIVDYANQHEIDLIVMGTAGRTGLAHLALGSVAERVLRSSLCPVLVVKPDSHVQLKQLRSALESLCREFGNVLPGDRRETRVRLEQCLVEKLNLSSDDAARLITELQSAEALTWDEDAGSSSTADQQTGGRWRIDPDRLRDEKQVFAAREPTADTADASPAFDLIRRALKLRATDIHLDPGPDDEVMVRMRIDGRLEEYCRLDRNVAEHLQHQMKLSANLDIAEPFRPKEGRLRLPSWLSDLEVRITTAPVAGGEAIALRLFSRDTVFYPLEKLGLSATSRSAIEDMMKQGEGLILVTGPTGVGKTTTVYSMLESLGGGARNIVSIEDPVEFAAPFIRQMSVDERHGITMTSGLRTLLRMDPDIIFVGEIRDADAAEIAMRAASSGRHVFSTLHTRDVAATITAIRDLHIDNRSLAGNLTGIINQRLIRRLCPDCRQRVPISEQQRQVFLEHQLDAPAETFQAVGCESCRGTGFHGRIGVFEAAVATKGIGSAIASESTEADLRELIRSQGIQSLTYDALTKVRDGATSIDEAITLRWL